ncbi:MAG TPA: hypothetical protein VKV73_18470 [Chloroflexota bacterium]|nr:hypothetical protein [Chloroflexota bacterium]
MLANSRIRRAAHLGLAVLTVALGVLTPLAPSAWACSDPGPRDYPVAGGWFYTQQGRGCISGIGPDRNRGYWVLDDQQAAFWTEFRRYGGVEVLGFPVSQRFNYDGDGLVYQAFERGILQWHPETGRADMANVFEMFTKQGIDNDLLTLGIPLPAANVGLSFAADAERRMAWLSEPRFLARYFFDPVASHSSDPQRLGSTAFATQEQAWSFFGLPQSLPEQPFLMDAGAPVWPFVHTFLAQRFQKAGLQLFLQAAPNESFSPLGWTGSPSYLLDPTVVPGDGVQGCVALTAVGLLARTLGAETIIPKSAIQSQPADPHAPAFVQAFVPALTPGQPMLQFQLSGSAFGISEPVTIHLTDATRATTNSSPLPPVTSHVASTNKDGSWDQVILARVGLYEMIATGDTSGRTFDGTVDLSVPTVPITKGAASCRSVGLPVGAGGAPVPPVTAVPAPASRTTTTTTTTTSTVDGSNPAATDSLAPAPQAPVLLPPVLQVPDGQ